MTETADKIVVVVISLTVHGVHVTFRLDVTFSNLSETQHDNYTYMSVSCQSTL